MDNDRLAGAASQAKGSTSDAGGKAGNDVKLQADGVGAKLGNVQHIVGGARNVTNNP